MSKHRRARRHGLNISIRSSPTDSGYYSSETTPERLHGVSSQNLFLDGNGSSDNIEPVEELAISRASGNGLLDLATALYPVRTRPCTPKRTSSLRLYPSSVLVPDSKSGSESESKDRPPQSLRPRALSCSASKQSTSPFKHADRFIPLRDNITTLAEKFHVTKPTHALSPLEKILRTAAASPDYFINPRRLGITSGQNGNQAVQSEPRRARGQLRVPTSRRRIPFLACLTRSRFTSVACSI
jgi:hypothetical protein